MVSYLVCCKVIYVFQSFKGKKYVSESIELTFSINEKCYLTGHCYLLDKWIFFVFHGYQFDWLKWGHGFGWGNVDVGNKLSNLRCAWPVILLTMFLVSGAQLLSEVTQIVVEQGSSRELDSSNVVFYLSFNPSWRTLLNS